MMNIRIIYMCALTLIASGCSTSTIFSMPEPLETYNVYLDKTTKQQIVNTFGQSNNPWPPRFDTKKGVEGVDETLEYNAGISSGLNLCVNKGEYRICTPFNERKIKLIWFRFFNGILYDVHIENEHNSVKSYITKEWKKHADYREPMSR